MLDICRHQGKYGLIARRHLFKSSTAFLQKHCPSKSAALRGVAPAQKQAASQRGAALTTAAGSVRMKQAAEAPALASTSGLTQNGAGPHPRIPTVLSDLKALFRTALRTAFPDAEERASIAATREEKHGDYQCNNAMGLFGRMKGKPGAPKNPRAVAEAILGALAGALEAQGPDGVQLADTPALAGPGFINLRLSDEWMGRRVQTMLQQGIATWAPQLPYRRAVVDFSSPNVAKEMHVGHLRSTIIGDTVCRALEYCGVDVLRLNHVGDWGTQFGMLIQQIAETVPGGLDPESGASMEDLSDLQALYKESKKHFDTDEGFKERAQQAVVRLQGGDPLYVAAWQRICEASRQEFNAIYERLGVRVTERGESFYNPALGPLVEELLAGGIAEESDGAIVIFVDGIKVPLMIRKTDGGFCYGTTDMAAIKNRVQEEKGDWLIYITDAGQAPHFELVFGSARKAGIVPAENPPRIDHVGFGVVLGEDGQRIRTRGSEAAVRLVELLDEAKMACKANIRQRREMDGTVSQVDIAPEDFEEA